MCQFTLKTLKHKNTNHMETKILKKSNIPTKTNLGVKGKINTRNYYIPKIQE